MTNEAVNRLRRMISQGSEVERKLSAGVFRSIISDMITLYEENKKYRGKGILFLILQNLQLVSIARFEILKLTCLSHKNLW